MLNFFRKNPSSEPAPEAVGNKVGFFQKFLDALSKTRAQLGMGLRALFSGRRSLDEALLENLETLLLKSDVGLDATTLLIDRLRALAPKGQDLSSEEVTHLLQTAMLEMLPTAVPLQLSSSHVILMVGINGAGKTTSIGKIAQYFKQQDKKVLIAAGDTFRAAAVEQLKIWGDRNNVPVIAQHTGADSASVIFDAIQSAKAKNIDITLCDTAGRLHTQHQLMDELIKIKRVAHKASPGAPNDIWLVLDATAGQNGLKQALTFHQALGLTGLIVTKLDGTAKGGILFAISHALKLPIYFIGLGEGIEDLKPFVAEEFVEALFRE